MVPEEKNKQPFPYKNQAVNIILNEKKPHTYGYICMFMFGIKQPKSESLKIDIWTYQFRGFYVAR